MTLMCSVCSHENPAEAEFCLNCGRPLERDCPDCGAANPAQAKYCIHCGERQAGPKQLEPQSKLRSLQETTPPELSETIRSEQAEVEGVRKPVTILFTDIVGSTSIAEKLDPEIWKEIVVGAHQRVSASVYRYEGIIAQLLGDGVLAFFGAPITHEDDPLRAAHAALAIQHSVEAYAQELGSVVDDFKMRVGISTGTVVIGEIGSDMHTEYLAIGDAVNVAARLQSAADPGKVVISGPCARLVDTEFELKEIGELGVKGKAEPVQAFELVGVRAEPENWGTFKDFPTPYVGRAREMEKLRSCLLALCSGHGQIVAVMGDAGIGKTRLVEEVRSVVCDDAAQQETMPMSATSIRWLEGRALSYGGSLSYWTISQLLLADLGLSDGIPKVKIKVALRQRVRELFGAEGVDRVLPYLAYLLGVNGELEDSIRSFDGRISKDAVLKSVREYFRHVAEEAPTVLLFEDMHWADPSSLEALEGLLPLTDRAPLMILMLMRVERDHASWGVKLKVETDYSYRTTEILLSSLSKDDASSLLEQLLGAAKLPREIWRTIMQRAEGNPFYLEEVIRHLKDQGLIVRDEEGWHPTVPLDVMSIPDSLQGVLLARIDRLDEDVRSTLQMASVIGRSFLYKILETICEAETELDTHLSQLQREDLIREKARLPELEYIFKHGLTQEAAYDSLLYEQRKAIHLRVGKALENLFADRAEEFLGILAYHFEAAGANPKAVEYLQKAGDQARQEYGHNEAVDFYERALAILNQDQDHESAARTLMKLGLTYHTAFDFNRSRQAFSEAFAVRRLGATIQKPRLQPASHPLRLIYPGPLTLDPSLADEVSAAFYLTQMFSGLVEMAPGWEIVPDVAESWEISDDGRRYVFHLRDDVLWSDGTQLTARDFVCSWIRSSDPAAGALRRRTRLLYDVVNAQAFNAGELSDPDQVGVKATDRLTLAVDLARSSSTFLHILYFLYPVPSHLVGVYGDAWTDPGHIVTNGPFKVDSYEPSRAMRLVRNKTYHGRFPGNVEAVEIEYKTDMLSLDGLNLYEADKVDVIRLSAKTYDARHRYAAEYQVRPTQSVYSVEFDSSRPPFSDVRVRRAFVMAVDKERLNNEVLDGFMDPASGGYIPPGIPGHSPGIGLSYDPGQARRLLEEAGYPNGQGMPDLTLTWLESGRAVLESLKADWSANLGIDVALEFSDWAGVLRNYLSCRLSYMGYKADYPDPDEFLEIGAQTRMRGWNELAFVDLVRRARRTMVQDDRLALYQAADKLLIEQAGIMPLGYSKEHLLTKPWVTLPVDGEGAWRFKDVVISPH